MVGTLPFDVVNVYNLTRKVTIHRDKDTKAASALVRVGYLPVSPVSPSLAVSLRMLELFYTLCLFKPNLSVEAFAKASLPPLFSHCSALSDTFDVYLALCRKVDAHVATELGHNSPDYRVLNSCPPCNYELEDEPPLTFTRMFVADSNNSLKRMDGVGKREVSDTCMFGESDYYLSKEYVNTFADEVKARPPSKNAIDDGGEEEDFEGDWVDEVHGDPTNGAPSTELLECTKNWKAAAHDSLKKIWNAFRESGYFATACHHGFILWVVDMIRSGELAKYPLAMVAKALKVFGPQWLFGYDIGCSFSSTIHNSSLGPEFKEKCCRTCMNAFHGYSHNTLCQQIFHPLNIIGMGLEDLETLERLFSSSNQLSSLTCYMSSYRWRVFIDLFLWQWDHDKYQNLATMLHNNYLQALDILENKASSFKADLQALNITEDDIETYLADETRHLAALGTEKEEDLHAVVYVDLLRKYRETSAAYENSGTSFRLHIPEDYQFLSDTTSYSVNLSETQKAETRRRFLHEQASKILFEVVQISTVMGITHCWQPSDPEYLQAVEYINTRKYRQALECLHKLVVQQLFELHKMNLSNTGYKMQTHISNALQRRSKAIQNAVNAYNIAAVALNPPRDMLDWSKVSHYTFLNQFNILQGTQHSVFDQPWAKPMNWTLMKQHHRIARTHEEIIRCNVEIRRLHTLIVDEGKHFDIILAKLADSPMLGPVTDYVRRRQAVNSLLLARINQTYDLEGYTSERTPGTRKGSANMQDDPNSAATTPPQPTNPGSDIGEDEDDDEFTEEVDNVLDFMLNMSLQ
ncbi:hypothetical protein BT96DRAFT_1081007 [Gymnopus androsaceus JB14]|uniref:CxC1-like cysteine cluster associated with KDZ transposases domain-containing protein n=1 Tax=Gymnopus androsaceus JB14 TaxID=1447944 RepID=A0A6A4GPR1_9AGAR|nr:hypothetical protein BT96DRAFT_1081007 [Gymnopus androsaceus JB14]